MKLLNSDFSHFFWDNSNVPSLTGELTSVKNHHQSHGNWVHIADMLRYLIVRDNGGIYLDCDYEPLKPITELEVEKYDGFLPLHFNPGETICNSIFGFKKGHPLMEYVCSKIVGHSHWLGPHFFGKYVKEYLGLEEEALDVQVAERLRDLNIKVIHSRDDLKKNYLIHHLAYTWHPENQKKNEIGPIFYQTIE